MARYRVRLAAKILAVLMVIGGISFGLAQVDWAHINWGPAPEPVYIINSPVYGCRCAAPARPAVPVTEPEPVAVDR